MQSWYQKKTDAYYICFVFNKIVARVTFQIWWNRYMILRYSAAMGKESRRKSSFPSPFHKTVAGHSLGILAQFLGYHFPGNSY